MTYQSFFDLPREAQVIAAAYGLLIGLVLGVIADKVRSGRIGLFSCDYCAMLREACATCGRAVLKTPESKR